MMTGPIETTPAPLTNDDPPIVSLDPGWDNSNDDPPIVSLDPGGDGPKPEKPQHRGIFGNFLRKLIVKNDGDHDAAAAQQFSTAVSRFEKGNPTGAFKIINKLLVTNPDFIKPWIFCGEWYHDNQEYAEALYHYEEAIKLGTISPHDYLRAAYSASRCGDIERAYVILRLSTTKLSHDDVPGILWFSLGCYATLLQKNDEAMGYLKDAFNKEYNNVNEYLTDPDLIPLRHRQDFLMLLGIASTDEETGRR